MFLYMYIGVLGSLFSFLQFLASPLAGCLSDCYGRKPALLVSMVYNSLTIFRGISIIKLFVMCFRLELLLPMLYGLCLTTLYFLY